MNQIYYKKQVQFEKFISSVKKEFEMPGFEPKKKDNYRQNLKKSYKI